MHYRALLTLGSAVALAACSATGGAGAASASDKGAETASAEIPFASTYSAYPGAPTALVSATVFDGAGNRIDNGTVLFADGKVVEVGDASLAIPEGYTRIDGMGKYVTPGIIDIHSHLGDYPTPSVQLMRMETRRPARPPPKYGPNIPSGRKIPALAARWPMAA